MATTQRYAGDWKDYADVVSSTSYGDELPKEPEIVYAEYENGGYDGSAIIVFVRDGKWYENNDSHCSCNGLDTWSPEETTPEALLMQRRWSAALGAAVRDMQRKMARRKNSRG